MRRYAPAVLLGLILCLGAGLRLYHLSTVPTELIADEVDLYDSVYSIATTGHDLDGSLRPFLYSPFTRNPPVYGIAGYVSTLALGKTAFALRLPAVVFGLTSVVLLYGLALTLTGRRDVALIAALLQATQPIFIQFSRIAWEPSSELPFLLGGLYALAATLQRFSADPSPQPRLSLGGLMLAAVLLGITAYTYMAGWFYAVILGGSLVLLNARTFRSADAQRKLAAACAIWLLVALPALWTMFADPLTAGKEARVGTFAHGITLEALRHFAINYAAHFRATYLVTTGDPKVGVTWRYLNGFGAFYWFVIALAAAGVPASLQYVRENGMRVWLWVWLAAYPLGGALTNDGAPNAPRTLAGAPVFCLLAAIGFALFADWAASARWKRAPQRAAAATTYAVLLLACAWSVGHFSSFYFTQYVHRNSNAWDSGTRALFAAIRANRHGYDRVCFNVHPAWYEVSVYSDFYLSGVPLQRFDSIDPQCLGPGTLIATDSEQRVNGFRTLATIRDVDGSNFAFVIGRR